MEQSHELPIFDFQPSRRLVFSCFQVQIVSLPFYLRFNLEGNRLTNLGFGLFDNLKKLFTLANFLSTNYRLLSSELYIDYNSLTTLDERIFNSLTVLQTLYFFHIIHSFMSYFDIATKTQQQQVHIPPSIHLLK